MKSETILIVEDNAEVLDSLKNMLTLEGYQVISAADGRAGLETAILSRPDLILLDMNLPFMSGLELLESLRQAEADTPVILMTVFGSERIAIEAFKLGVRDYLTKPFSAEDILAAAEKALGERRLARQRDELERNLVAVETVRTTVATLSHYLGNYLMTLDVSLSLLDELYRQRPDPQVQQTIQNGKASVRGIQAVIQVLRQVADVNLTPYSAATPMIDIEAALRKELDRLASFR